MKKRQKKIIFFISVIVAAFLLLTLAYIFLLKPALNGFLVEQQTSGINQGVAMTVSYLIQQASTCPPEGVPVYMGGVTLHIVAKECENKVPEVKLS